MHNQAPVIVEPTTKPTHAVIWLHGLGADGHDFASVVPLLGLPKELGIRFIFPHAPIRSITLNGGAPMRGWFDIVSLDLMHEQDETGIRASQTMVHQLITEQNQQGIPSANIILGGFSQGGIMAFHTGLRYGERLGGILALSTLLMLAHKLPTEAHSANKNIPIFFAHGIKDAIIPVGAGKFSKVYLENLGYKIDWRTYDMAHSVCDQELKDIKEWLVAICCNACVNLSGVPTSNQKP